MNSLVRLGTEKLFNLIKTTQSLRNITVSSSLKLKQIQEIQNGKELVIEGIYLESPRSKHMINLPKGQKCSLCALGLNLKHTDVLVLSQFVRSDGCMLPKRVTGLCYKQQKRVSTLVSMAQKAGLMSNLNPSNSKKDPTSRFGYKKYNKYFDESTIKFR